MNYDLDKIEKKLNSNIIPASLANFDINKYLNEQTERAKRLQEKSLSLIILRPFFDSKICQKLNPNSSNNQTEYFQNSQTANSVFLSRKSDLTSRQNFVSIKRTNLIEEICSSCSLAK
ncbi:MAG: hypothetical protein RR248_05020 [Clostridia bacterium]